MAPSVALWYEAAGHNALARKLPCESYRSAVELEALVRERQLAAIVISTRTTAFACLHRLRQLVEARTVRCPLVLEAPEHRTAYDFVMPLLAAGAEIHVAPVAWGVDGLTAAVNEAIRNPAGAPLTLLADAVRRAPGASQSITVAAAVLGGRRATPRLLAQSLALTPRSLRRILTNDGVPSAGALLGMATAYHFTFRVGALGLTPEDARIMAGFLSQDTMRLHLKRTTGLTPRDWLRLGPLGAVEKVAELLKKRSMTVYTRFDAESGLVQHPLT